MINPNEEWATVRKNTRMIRDIGRAFPARSSNIGVGEYAAVMDRLKEALDAATAAFGNIRTAITGGLITAAEMQEIIGYDLRPVPANVANFDTELTNAVQPVFTQYGVDTATGNIATLNYDGSLPHTFLPATVSPEMVTAMSTMTTNVETLVQGK